MRFNRFNLAAVAFAVGSTALVRIPSAAAEAPADPVAEYETALPNEAVRNLPPLEARLLVRYLNHPRDERAALAMAAYHALRVAAGSAHGSASGVRHAIYAEYFLHRARQLGAAGAWVHAAIHGVHEYLARALPVTPAIDSTEGNPAHQSFIQAFNYEEAQRYEAEELLLKDVLERPTNLLTNLYLAAVNLWNAGESRYDDPGVLYAYLGASYFGRRVTELSKRAETEWETAPETRTLFRLAPAVGGFTIPSRRWLAKFHGDAVAVELLDQELGEWFVKYPQFYMFPAGMHAFNEPDNVAAGFSAFLTGSDACTANPNVFCFDHPRATYNVVSFFMFAFDYYMKVGQVDAALGMLELKYVPQFRYETWYLGHDAWEHRESNAARISALYQNQDPLDDPISGFQKRHQWGPVSSTCQLCHQVQGATWSEEEKANVASLDPLDRYVGDWPISEVAWDGSIR